MKFNICLYLKIVPFFIIFAFLFFWTNDLSQNNDEKLFLGKVAKERYLKFLNLTQETTPLLIILKKDEINGEINQNDIERIKLLKDNNFAETNVLINDLFDIYGNNLQEQTLLGLKKFLKENPLASFAMKSNFEYPLFVNFPLTLSVTDKDKFFKNLKKNIEYAGNINFKILYAGLPYINHALNSYSEKIKTMVIPLMFVVMACVLFFFLRKLKFVFLILFPSALSLLLTNAFIKVLYHDLNMITAVAPLMVFVINASTLLHIAANIAHYQKMQLALREKLLPISLTVITTMIGFGSLYVAPIEAIKQLAVVSFFAIPFTLFVSIMFVTLLPFSRDSEIIENKKLIDQLQYRLSEESKKRVMFSFFIILATSFIILFLFVLDPKIVTDATTFFPKDSKIKNNIEYVANNYKGTPQFEIILSKLSEKNNNMDNEEVEFDYDDFVKILELENALERFSGLNKLSLNTFVEEGNYLYSKIRTLPENKFAYNAIRSMIPEETRTSYVGEKFYRISLNGPPLGDDKYQNVLRVVQETLQRFDLYEYFISGLQYELQSSHSDLIFTLVSSIISSILLITLLVAFFYRSFKILIIFLIINSLPIILSFPLIHICKISLNVATILAFSISLGLIVDSTIHLIDSYKKGEDEFLRLKKVKLPIYNSTLILTLGFASFMVNDFLPVKNVGLLLSILISIGGLADLYLFPVLWNKFFQQPNNKEKEIV